MNEKPIAFAIDPVRIVEARSTTAYFDSMWPNKGYARMSTHIAVGDTEGVIYHDGVFDVPNQKAVYSILSQIAVERGALSEVVKDVEIDAVRRAMSGEQGR